MLRRLAWWLLRFAEWFLLLAYNWRRREGTKWDARDAWMTPIGHPNPDQKYDHDHALNSTKFYMRKRTQPHTKRRDYYS